MSDQPKTSEVLNRGADLIEVHGHHKGSYGSPAEGFCIMGACNAAVGGVSLDASAAVHQFLEGRANGVIEFNDAPDRTAAEVIEVLRAAAVIEAARESAAVRESVSA